jgi:ribonuclease HI
MRRNSLRCLAPADVSAAVQVGRLVLALQRQTNNVAEYCGLIIGLEVI